MQTLRVRHLIAHVGMTFNAPREIGSAKRCVAQLAARFEIGVRDKSSERLVERMFRAQGTRREWYTARYGEDANQTNKKQECCATTQERSKIFHNPKTAIPCRTTKR